MDSFGFDYAAYVLFLFLAISPSYAWLFTPVGSSVAAEHRRCEPSDPAWRPYPQDPTRFLLCDVGRRRFTVRQCPFVQGSRQMFDATKKRCVASTELTDFKLMTPSEQRVGDTCYVNQDCADGMYCNNGVCACFLNYIEVNMKCIRVSTICANSHFYAELHTGKPRTCTADIHCPVNFACEVHPGMPDINFCCYKPTVSSEVCGAGRVFTDRGVEVLCSPDFPRVQCPPDYWCRYNSQLRRHYCCQIGFETPSTPDTVVGLSSTTVPTPTWTASSTSALPPAVINATLEPSSVAAIANDTVSAPNSFGIEKVLGQTVQLAELVCGQGFAPWIFEGFPMPCSPLPPGVCPPGFLCKSVNGSRLHFCCNDHHSDKTTATSTASSSSISSTRPPGTTSSPTTSSSTTPSSVCPNSSPYLLHGQPLICVGSDSRSCPQNYTCQSHYAGNISFCCSTDVGAVTNVVETRRTAAHAYRNESYFVCGDDGEPLNIGNATIMCVKDDPYSCPADYVCQHHASSNAQYCCKLDRPSTVPSSTVSNPTVSASTDREGCPPSTHPARDPYGRAMTCTLNHRIRSCPSDYNCTYSEAYSRFQCCGSRPVPAASTTVSPITTSTSDATPVSFAAPASTPESISTTASTKEDQCPVGQRSFKDASTNAAKSCIVNTPGNCPSGYFCQFSSQANRFLCCGVHAGCPTNGVAFINPGTGLVQTCNNTSTEPSVCPSNYHCAATSSGRKVCCSGDKLLCRTGDPLMERAASSKIRTCSLAQPCPDQWACLPSRVGSVCCPKPSKSEEHFGRDGKTFVAV